MKMKKRLILFACMLVMMLSLVSCGKSIDQQSRVYGYSRSSLKESVQSMTTNLAQISAEDAAKQAEQYRTASETATGTEKEQDVMYETLLQNWADNAETLGDLKGFGTFKIEKAGKTVTATQAVSYAKRTGKVIFTFNVLGDRMKLTSMNVNVDYSLGETMSKAALNVLMGMLVVFSVLIIISLVIYAFRIIPYLQKKFSGQEDTEKQAAVKEEVEETEETADDGELVAVIAAAVAASTGMTTDDFVVRSIRRRY
ncbi:MAG: OadG family protein [Lachnospiraceae bacterium]|nr:OadG family protein [Lachnospiraceae bacterium]MDD6451709.1 OadG family protein [Lachnospiraceae bacterium]MDD6578661.1 OadG family protein [Lachnospiraceae bacterium]